MNEPSVFKISRNTVPKNSIIKYDKTNYEHREAHNLYGYLMHKATYEALIQKYKNKIRPFILTRSFYIGSHKYSAMWTGDTKSNFDDLKNAIPMMITLSLSGYSFVGCDVGGFAEEGNINLYIRWYQNGVFYPFFRGHSHESTLRREIWLYSEEDFLNMKNSILLRYTIIPYIYTQFYLLYKTGIPIIKPVWFYYKSELALTEFADKEYFFGNSILVRPVLSSQEDLSNIISVYLPENERWYDFYNYKEVKNNKKFDYQINPNTLVLIIFPPPFLCQYLPNLIFLNLLFSCLPKKFFSQSFSRGVLLYPSLIIITLILNVLINLDLIIFSIFLVVLPPQKTLLCAKGARQRELQ